MRKSLKKLLIVPLMAALMTACGNVDDSKPSTEPPADSTGSSATEAIHVESVTLDKTSLDMYVGAEDDLVASVLPANADNKNIKWSSSSTETVSVNNGHIVALKIGTATITATSEDGNKTATCTVNVLKDVLTFAVQGETKKAITRDVNFDLKKSDSIQLDVKKNGVDLLDKTVKITMTGDEGVLTYKEKENVDYCYDVTLTGKNGTVTLTFALEGQEEVEALSVTYNVTEYFLNQTIKRANVDETDNKITFDGSGQHTAVVKKKDTNWVLKATLDITKYTGNDSIGLGGFLDNGDHALWFGLKNNDGAADQYSGIYIQDFYSSGWFGKAIPTPKSYEKVAFNENEGRTALKVDCELIRKGKDYYYNLGGYHGKYTSDYEGASYAGFYSQAKSLTITNYSIAYGEEAATAAIGDNYSENAKIDAGRFVNADLYTYDIAHGESRNLKELKMEVAPTYSKETYSMVVDERYAEHVIVDGLKITIKDTAPEGDMSLILKSASGKILDTMVFPVKEQPAKKSNDTLTVQGPTILNDDGSIVFPENKRSINGVGNEAAYDDSVEYGAILNQKVLGGDFTLEFDVSDYKTTAQYPKLMVSLGGVESQFYLAYGYNNGTNSRIETHTYSTQYYGGQWNNTEDFKDFDKNASHHFKIESKDGYYNFYVDNSTTPLTQKCDNDARNIIVPMQSYYSMLPVRFSTNGVSAKISNITVTSGEASSLKDIYTYSDCATALEGGFKATFPVVGWDVRTDVSKSMFASKLFANATGAYTAKFDVTFSKAMVDAKLAIAFGNHEFHICNAGNKSKLQSYPGNWGANLEGIALSATNLTTTVTLVNDGNGKVTISVPLANGETGSLTDTSVNPSFIPYFWTFNGTEADADTTVTVSNISITKTAE